MITSCKQEKSVSLRILSSVKDQIEMAKWLSQSFFKTVGCSYSAVKNTYQSNEGQLTNKRQGHCYPKFISSGGEQGLSILCVPIKGQMLKKLLKKLRLVLIEQCQNTQRIAAYCVWGCVAVKWLELPWLLQFTTESFWEFLIFRSGPQCHQRR